MADYQRILSYLYRYEKAEKKECLGFVKAEQKSGSLKLTIQIDDERLLQGMELKLCFYERQGESWQVWQMDTVTAQEHKEELHLTYPADTLPKGFRIKGQSGVLLYYQDGFYYGTVWIGEEIPTEVLEPLRWHKIGKAAESEPEIERKDSKKDISGEVSENQKEIEGKVSSEKLEKQEEIEGKVSGEKLEKQEEIEGKVSGEKLEKQEEIEGKVSSEKLENREEEKEKISGELSEEQNVSAKDISNKVLEKSKELAENISDRMSEGQKEPTENVSSEKLEEQDEAEPLVDGFEKMWINSAKGKIVVDNIFNTAFYGGCKVSAAELEQFGEEAASLKSNQFLLKGYERYHHLLAGKVRYAGEKRYCVGVPGIYENREKYMADIYQFPVFLSLTENRMKTGSFGYWLYLLGDRG